jgi:16S rRNA (guanine527-N7)-methyltransferase
MPGLERPLTSHEGDQLHKYLNILLKWQKSHRLVGSVDPQWLTENVVMHSLAFLGALPVSVRALADVGSGAGLPGIPLAIARPELELTLIEARQRRVSFLSTVVRELELAGVRVVGARVESLGQEYVGAFDAVVMRCAGEVASVLPPARRLVRTGGVVVVSANAKAVPPVSGRRIWVSVGGVGRRAFDQFPVD